MKIKQRGLHTYLTAHPRVILSCAVILLLVAAGLVTLQLSKAESAVVHYTAAEAEAATITGNAASGTDSTASGGAAVSFGTTSNGDGTGKWWSGQSDSGTTMDGSFATWRGRPIEIAGSWAATDTAGNAIGSPGWSFASGAPYGSIPRLDWAMGGLITNSGENWRQAAAGAYDARWAQQLQAMKAGWGSRKASDMNIRFVHEFNGDWYPWKVTTADVSDFKTAWQRFYKLTQINFPGARVVWCPNATSSYSYDIRSLYPGDSYVDIVAVDSYNNYPWTSTQAQFDTKAASVSSFGGPTGVESFRQFAQLHGKPMAVSEWANAGVANQGGGGESPQFMDAFYTWLQKNGSQTPAPGKVLYEVLFNVTGFGDHYSMYPLNAETGNTATAAEYQKLW